LESDSDDCEAAWDVVADVFAVEPAEPLETWAAGPGALADEFPPAEVEGGELLEGLPSVCR